MRIASLLAVVAMAAALASGASATTVATYYGFNYLGPQLPQDRCQAVFPSSHSVACSGWNYWDRTRVYKYNGGWIDVGFWGPGYESWEMWFHGVYADPPIVVTRFDVVGPPGRGAAPPYNTSMCRYDFDQTPTPSSYVQCQALLFN